MGPAAALAPIIFFLSSPAFGNGGTIPPRYTCDGANISPPLRWVAPPRGTASLSLSMVDPDAKLFVHWSASGISPRVRSLPAGVHLRHEGVNGFGKRGYGGPCPPRGPAHRYIIVLTALDARGRMLAQGGLMGVYARKRTLQAATAARTVRVWDDQLASSLTDAQLRFVASHEDGAQKLPRSQIDALHRLNPAFTVLQYRLAIGLGRHTQILDGDRWVNEWPAHAQERWFAHVGGRRELQTRWGWYLTNPDDPAWERYFTTQLRAQVARTHADAVFLDSASPPTYFGGSAWSPPLRDLDLPFERAWSRRLERWLPYVQRTVGKPVVANAGSLITTRDTTDYSHIAGVMIEGFGQGLAAGDWLLQQQRASSLASKGRIVICQSYPSTPQERLFDVASYLLVKGPRTYVNLETTMQPEWWPEYDVDLGRPLGPPSRGQVSSRDYERGRVFVNPSDAATSVPYAGQLVVPHGGGAVGAGGETSGTVSTTPVTQLALPARSGAIVLR